MKRILFVPVLALVAAACSADTTDFKSQTEDFLKDNSEVEAVIGVDVTDATCQEPSSTEVGTEYTCDATDADGGEWTFDITIDSEDSFLVTAVAPK